MVEKMANRPSLDELLGDSPDTSVGSNRPPLADILEGNVSEQSAQVNLPQKQLIPRDMTEQLGQSFANFTGQSDIQNFLRGKRGVEDFSNKAFSSMLPQGFQDFIGKNMPQSAPNLRGIPSYMQTPEQNRQMATEDLLSLTSPAALTTMVGIPAIKGISKFRLNTPKVMNEAALGAIGKIKGRVDFLKQQYKNTYEPFNKEFLPTERTAPVIESIPKRLRSVLSDFLGTKIVDKKGNPSFTVGDMKKLEWHLDDNIKSNPDLLGRLKMSSQEVVNLSDKIHGLVLDNLPKEVGENVSLLDKQFSQVINPAQSALKKIAEIKNGKVIMAKTEYLSKIFKNPDYAGAQEFFKGLKGIGIDLHGELGRFKSYAGRQAGKEVAKRIGERALEGTIIGGVLRGGR